jgi:hypothetical protein
LNQALTRELESMIAEGAAVSPISLSAVARRLALGSRTTLYEPARLERIRNAQMRQQQALRGAMSARQSDTGNVRPQSEMHQLRRQLNELRSYVVQIAINAHRMGMQPDLLLSLSQRETKTAGSLDADRLAIEYLSGIGLLTKLDINVRGLAR